MELIGKKVFYDVKNLRDIEGKDFLIIGGGDAAFDYALNLSRQARSIRIIFRGERPKSLLLLQDRVKDDGTIKLHSKTSPSSVHLRQGRVITTCISDGREVRFGTDYLILALGREPNLELLKEKVSIKEHCKTDIPGLYLAGDVRHGIYRQVGIAVGDGLMAAMAVSHFLKGDAE